MHITAARSLTILGVFAYSSTASAWPQTSISPQNALEYNLAAEPTLSPIPSDTSLSMIAISQHIDTDTEPEDAHHARNLGPFGQEGFNIATYRTGAPTDAEVVATSPIPTPVPSITAVSKSPHTNFPFVVKEILRFFDRFKDLSWSREFLTPTTTIIVPASTIYYTVATVTITARDVDALETGSGSVLVPLSEAPRTFQTITRSSASTTSAVGMGNQGRGFEEKKERCEKLGEEEVLGCLEREGLLVPWTTVTQVRGGKTMVEVGVSLGVGRRRGEARVTGGI
ncbi:hypothetical protein ACHAPF_008097 [Botrytis cinerea]